MLGPAADLSPDPVTGLNCTPSPPSGGSAIQPPHANGDTSDGRIGAREPGVEVRPDRHPEGVRRRGDHVPGRVRRPGRRGHLDRLARPGPGPGRQGHAPRPDHRDLRQRGQRQDDHRPARHRQRPEGRAGWRRSSTPSTPSTRAGPSGSAWTWRACWSASRATARRRCASPRCSSSRTPWTSSSSTRWRPWCPKNELNNEIGDPSVGMQARLMSQALRILNPTIGKTRTCMIFINQIRQKIGVMYGNPETTTGGLALKFYASRPAGGPQVHDDQGRGRADRHARSR